MLLRTKQTGAVITNHEFLAAFPNTSFTSPITEQTYNDFGYDVVLDGPPANPTRYQVAYQDGVQESDGVWRIKYSVMNMDADGIADKDSQQTKAVRDTRNARLSACDWTQLADSTADKTAWATYRQALRDIPTQSGFPWEVIWPTQP